MIIEVCVKYHTIYDEFINNSNDFYQSIKLIDDVLRNYTNNDDKVVSNDDVNDATCMLMIISQCFKSSRSPSAHPERYIGKAYDTISVNNEYNDSNKRSKLLHLMMNYMKPLIITTQSTMQSRMQSVLMLPLQQLSSSPSLLASFYFFISLFYDFMIEMNSHNYISEGMSTSPCSHRYYYQHQAMK